MPRYLAITALIVLLALPFAVDQSRIMPFISTKVILFRWVVVIMILGTWREVRVDRIGLWLLTLLFMAMISDLFSADRQTAFFSTPYRLDGFVQQAFLTVFYFAAIPLMRRTRLKSRYLDAMLILSLLVVPAAGILNPVYFDAQDRPDTLFNNPTYYGGYALWMIFLAYYQMRRIWDWRWLIILANIAGILICRDRGALVGLECGIGAILTVYRQWKVMAAGVATCLIGPPFVTRDSDISARLGLWAEIPSYLHKHWLFGLGHEGLLGYGQHWDRAHNLILDWLIEGGMVSLLCHVLIGMAVWQALKKFHVKHRAALIGGFAAWFGNGLFIFDTIATAPILYLVMVVVNADHGMTFGLKMKGEEVPLGV